MSVVISGFVAVLKESGTFTPLAGKKIYLLPSRTDFEFSMDGGTTWYSWQGDPNIASQYPGAISTTTGGSGDWGFTVPWTDSTSETRLPGGALVPDLFWNIIDPNPTTGTIVYYGKTKQAVVAAAKTIKELITLASPDTWQVGSVTYTAVPVGPRRFVTVPFTSASASASIVFPTMGSANWRVGVGVRSDDSSKTYAPIIDSTTQTAVGATMKLSDVPPAGKTVYVDVEIY